MGDFLFLSDSEDDKAVENLLSQAMDHSILEQVAAINCSNFTSDSDLPSHLETRFQKLKSFPNTQPKPQNLKSSSSTFNSHLTSTKPSKQESDEHDGKRDLKGESDSDSMENGIFSPAKQTSGEKKDPKLKSKSKSKSKAKSSFRKENPDGKKGLKIESDSDFCDSPSTENGIFSPAKQSPDEKMGPKSKSESKSNSKKENPDGKKGLMVERESDFDYSDSKVSDSSENTIFSPAKHYPDEKNCPKSKSKRQKENPAGKNSLNLKLKSQTDFSFSPSKRSDSTKKATFSASKQYPSEKMSSKSNSWSSSEESESPTHKIGCFWCSPKRVSRKKSKENRISEIDLNWGNDDEPFSFSTTGQKRMMKKVIKEQEKINREAEKIVKWAKRASARLDVSSLEDELSDDESLNLK